MNWKTALVFVVGFACVAMAAGTSAPLPQEMNSDTFVNIAATDSTYTVPTGKMLLIQDVITFDNAITFQIDVDGSRALYSEEGIHTFKSGLAVKAGSTVDLLISTGTYAYILCRLFTDTA